MKTDFRKTHAFPFLRNLFWAILSLITGFIISLASFPMAVHPTGIALASFIPGKAIKFHFFTNISFYYLYMGIVAATFAYTEDGFVYFTMYCTLFLIRLAMTSGKFNETRNIKMILSAISSLCIGFVGGAINGFDVWHTFGILLLSVCSLAFTYLFCELTEGKGTVSVEAGCGALIFALLYGMKGLRIFSFSVPFIISGFLTFMYAKKKGPLYGALVGFVCGIASDSFLLPPVLGILGFSSGMFFEQSEAFSILLGYLSSLAYGIYCAGFDAVGMLAPELLASCAAFYPIKHFISASRHSPAVPQTNAETTVTDTIQNKKLTDMSEAFSELSRLSLKSEEIRVPDITECDYYVKRAFEEACGECMMKHVCEISGEKESQPLRNVISRALCERKLAVGQISDVVHGKCCNTEKIASISLRNYKHALIKSSSHSKARALSGEYNTMAKLLKNASQNNTSPPPLREAFRIKRALENLGMEYRKIEVSGNRNAVIKVLGISAEKIKVSGEHIQSEIEKECGFAVDVPEFRTESSEEVMQVKRRAKISLEYAKASLTKNGEHKNGDKISVFETDDDRFYSLICDGMGSGSDAAQASALASGFIEKLVLSHLERDITIEILNNYLISKDTECFSTVDLLEIDKVEAEASFIKAGAAPAFVIRYGKLHKISSCTPPAGVLYNMTAEKTLIKLQKEDVVVMMSDGIMENSDVAPWLMELFTYSLEGSASEMAEKILSSACSINGRKDDMSIAVIKIL